MRVYCDHLGNIDVLKVEPSNAVSRLHYLPNAYGYGVMWMPLDFKGTPAVEIPV